MKYLYSSIYLKLRAVNSFVIRIYNALSLVHELPIFRECCVTDYMRTEKVNIQSTRSVMNWVVQRGSMLKSIDVTSANLTLRTRKQRWRDGKVQINRILPSSACSVRFLKIKQKSLKEILKPVLLGF